MLNLRLKPDTFEALRDAARAKGISPAAFISNLLDATLHNLKQGEITDGAQAQRKA